MLSLATSLAGCDVLQAVLSLLGHGNWFATDENEWAELFGHHLPTWLTVSNRTVLKGYYMGESSLYIPLHLQTWLPVVLNRCSLIFGRSLGAWEANIFPWQSLGRSSVCRRSVSGCYLVLSGRLVALLGALLSLYRRPLIKLEGTTNPVKYSGKHKI